MNVYGVGPPRSGTTMLAECLSVVKPTVHECKLCAADGMMRNAWTEPERFENHEPHGAEVAFWFTPLVGMFDNSKIIHLWRPVDDWLNSMVGRWPFCDCHIGENKTCPGGLVEPHKGFDFGYWGSGRTPSAYLSLYKGYHMTLLELSIRRDTYVVKPEDIKWEDLLDYLEWPHTDEQVSQMYAIQQSKPNKGTPIDNHGVDVDESARSIERILQFKNRGG